MVKNNGNPMRAAKPPTDSDGNPIHSKILLGLSSRDSSQVIPKLEFIRLKLHQLLYNPGDTIKSVYFINEGMISVLAVQPDGKSVEVGLIGNEGFAGLPMIVGYRSNPTRLICQGDGSAYRCDAQTLRQLVRQSPELEQELHRYAYRLAMQTTQIAACNRLHDVEERLARWILMTDDRLLSKSLPLTQEFLAQMLGTRRSSVTVSAGILQKAGLISYTRGSITILNRQGLEGTACDCYEIVQTQLREWEAEIK